VSYFLKRQKIVKCIKALRSLRFPSFSALMVDGFWSMRAEDSQRQSALDGSCFVCVFTRVTYSDIPHFKGPSFDHHKNITHGNSTCRFLFRVQTSPVHAQLFARCCRLQLFSSCEDYLKYVYFWIYLKRKEKTELSGAETYVWRLICDDLDLRWVPVRNTAAIQAISSKH